MHPSEMARILGSRGGRARGAKLPPVARMRIASLGGQARARSLQAARRIEENLRYAAAAEELRGGAKRLRRESTFGGRLPEIGSTDG